LVYLLTGNVQELKKGLHDSKAVVQDLTAQLEEKDLVLKRAGLLDPWPASDPRASGGEGAMADELDFPNYGLYMREKASKEEILTLTLTLTLTLKGVERGDGGAPERCDSERHHDVKQDRGNDRGASIASRGQVIG